MNTAGGPKRFVILGGGTAGWMAAACLARLVLKDYGPKVTITLVESQEIGIVGVGEATIPSIQDMLRFLNIDELDFIKNTQATYKLAILFKDWHTKGQDFWHPFGTMGPSIDTLPLAQFWLAERLRNDTQISLQSLSVCSQMAEKARFSKPQANQNSCLSGASYAYHFDTTEVGPYLRGYAQAKGVARIEGKVSQVEQDESGDITALRLDDGQSIDGDFFIDCSGFAGLLIDKTLGSDFIDWSHWLPCDQAVAAPCQSTRPIVPYTIAHARDAGWTWRIPLQSRTGNGYVFSSSFVKPEAALQTLQEGMDQTRLAEPRYIKFKPGYRSQTWVKNCLSLGLASGFLEPLESTNIHFVFSNLFRFFEHFPVLSDYDCLRQRYNALCRQEIEETRDFIILHYCLSARRDTEFWRYVTSMPLPETLRERMDLYQNQGRILSQQGDLFRFESWISIYEGMGYRPKTYNPLTDTVPNAFVKKALDAITKQIESEVLTLPSHDMYLKKMGLLA